MVEKKSHILPHIGFVLERLSPPRNLNVIVVLSDTFRRDHVGTYGNRANTPNLDRFAKEAAIFEEAYVASFPTIPNRTDHFTGRYTFPWRPWSPLPTNDLVLAEAVGFHDVISMLIADNHHLFEEDFNFNRRFSGWYFNRGQEGDNFTTDADIPIIYPCSVEKIASIGDIPGYLHAPRYENICRNRYHRRVETDWFAPGTISKAMDWLDHNYRHKSFLLWVDLFDCHEPFDPPQYYIDLYDPDYDLEEDCDYPIRDSTSLGVYSEREIKHIRARYKGEVTMVDKWFGRLMEKVDDLKLRERTMVIFTTDHGWHFGYPGDWNGTQFGKEITPEGFFRPIIHIPLLIRMPDGTGAGERIKGIVQPVDTMPTILDFLGITKPTSLRRTAIDLFDWDVTRGRSTEPLSMIPFHGKSVIPLIKDEMVNLREYALSGSHNRCIQLTNSEWSYSCTIKDGKWMKKALWDFRKDSTQKDNVINQKIDVANKLHKKLIKFLKSIDAPELVSC
ncbi:MAG: sulfatase [Promethearchaeota archaeon]|jgi:arylsulfatase A-like enzyme